MELTLTRLKSPELSINEGVITWEDASLSAEKFNVTITGTATTNQTIAKNSAGKYSFALSGVDAGTYGITVTAIGNGENNVFGEGDYYLNSASATIENVENINLKLDTVLGAKSFSKSGNIPGGTKLAGEWVLNDNNEYVFTMNIEGKAETEGEYLFSVSYNDETGKVVETKKYFINVEKIENEEPVSSTETVSDELSYIQGTWINHYQSNEIYGYKLVIEGNEFVIYNKRGEILQDKDGNEIKGTVEYWDITYSWNSNDESNKFSNYSYIFYWEFGRGNIYLQFDPETNEMETMLRLSEGGLSDSGGKANGSYYKET